MTFEESSKPNGRQPSPRLLLLIPALLFAGILSAILTVANPPEGVADIRAGLDTRVFMDVVPEYAPAAFDAYHDEETHEGDEILSELE